MLATRVKEANGRIRGGDDRKYFDGLWASHMDRTVCGTAYSMVFSLCVIVESPTISGYISPRVGIPTNCTNRSQTVPQTVRNVWENPQTVQTVHIRGGFRNLTP